MASIVSCQSSFDFSFKVQPWPTSKFLRQPEDEVAIGFGVVESRKILKFTGIFHRLASFDHTMSPPMRMSLSVPKHAALLHDGGALMASLLSELGVPPQHQEAVLRGIALEAAAATPTSRPMFVILHHIEVIRLHIIEPGDEMDAVSRESRNRVDALSRESRNRVRNRVDAVLRELRNLVDAGSRESMNVDFARTTPATRSSIQQLETVTYEEGLGSDDECIFCTQEFDTGLQLIRLPCSHVYHRDCIVKWLETSRLCPLCRYPLPAVSS